VLNPATAREIELLKELRMNCRQLPDRGVSGASDAENTWAKVLNHFRYLIATGDARKFLTWDILRTMFVGNPEYVAKELAFLKQRPDWTERWSQAIEETSVGHPLPFTKYPKSSGNLIHHAYHLCRFEEATGTPAGDFNFVLEFGGGYGSMCRLFQRLGFNGRYVVFDFPEFACLQQFFFKSLDMPVHPIETLLDRQQGIATVSDIGQLREFIGALNQQVCKSLFVATWSLSETSIDFRRNILDMVFRFDAFLIAYQDRFEEVDNNHFFSEWKSTNSDVQWEHSMIEHLPGNLYLVGRKVP
jgi:hypothetical protein